MPEIDPEVGETRPSHHEAEPSATAPLPDKERRRQERIAAKRARILDAAESLFARQDYVKTTVDEIATAASVSKGLIYLHFTGKEALLEAVVDRELADWSRATAHSVTEAGGTIVHIIANTLRASIEHARANPLLCAILAQEPRLPLPRDPQRIGSRTRVLDLYLSVLEPLLRHGVESGELRHDLDVPRTAYSIWLVHDGLVRSLFVESRITDDQQADALVEAAVAMVSNGIGDPVQSTPSVLYRK